MVTTAALAVLPATAHADDTPLVTTGPVFNDPSGDATAQKEILTKIGRLAQGATAGSRIRVSIYLMWSQWIADELVKAAARGVSVQVIADSDSNSTAYTTVNHDKFFLFSETTGTSASGATPVRDVVLQTSSNLTGDDLTLAWNDAMVVVGNSALHQAYADYFEDLRAAGSGETAQVADHPVETQAGVAKLYLFPRASADPVVNILSTVDDPVGTNAVCHGNSTGYGTSDGRTVIRIAMHQISRLAVAKKLWELDNAGCYVDVVYHWLDEAGSGTVAAQLAAPPTWKRASARKRRPSPSHVRTAVVTPERWPRPAPGTACR
jgi:hypothetical protein